MLGLVVRNVVRKEKIQKNNNNVWMSNKKYPRKSNINKVCFKQMMKIKITCLNFNFIFTIFLSFVFSSLFSFYYIFTRSLDVCFIISCWEILWTLLFILVLSILSISHHSLLLGFSLKTSHTNCILSILRDSQVVPFFTDVGLWVHTQQSSFEQSSTKNPPTWLSLN